MRYTQYKKNLISSTRSHEVGRHGLSNYIAREGESEKARKRRERPKESAGAHALALAHAREK